MIFPIENIPIKITDVDDSVEFFTLEAPNGDNPFYFQVEEIRVRGKYRDRNNILRRGYTLYQVRWFYTYETHNMDLRKLLTAKEIDLAAPPDFKNGDYPTYPVRFVNQDIVKNYVQGFPGGGHTYESFDTIPSGNVTLEFEIKNPVEWSDVLNIAWFEGPPET